MIRLVKMAGTDVGAVKIIEAENRLSPWSSEDYQKEIKRQDSISIVAKYKGDVAGFLVARLIKNEDIFVSQNSTEITAEAEIHNFAVKREFRNMGFGQRIFDKFTLAAKSKGARYIWLEVRESNHGAICFYKKNGFENVGVRKKFYRHPAEDAYILGLKPTWVKELD